jgi:hypothetical protein
MHSRDDLIAIFGMNHIERRWEREDFGALVAEGLGVMRFDVNQTAVLVDVDADETLFHDVAKAAVGKAAIEGLPLLWQVLMIAPRERITNWSVAGGRNRY